jgi:hypothetical protein
VRPNIDRFVIGIESRFDTVEKRISAGERTIAGDDVSGEGRKEERERDKEEGGDEAKKTNKKRTKDEVKEERKDKRVYLLLSAFSSSGSSS